MNKTIRISNLLVAFLMTAMIANVVIFVFLSFAEGHNLYALLTNGNTFANLTPETIFALAVPALILVTTIFLVLSLLFTSLGLFRTKKVKSTGVIMLSMTAAFAISEFLLIIIMPTVFGIIGGASSNDIFAILQTHASYLVILSETIVVSIALASLIRHGVKHERALQLAAEGD